MGPRSKSVVHYEAAFEDYLRRKGLPYIAVDEAKKALFAGAKLNSYDPILPLETYAQANGYLSTKAKNNSPSGGREPWELNSSTPVANWSLPSGSCTTNRG